MNEEIMSIKVAALVCGISFAVLYIWAARGWDKEAKYANSLLAENHDLRTQAYVWKAIAGSHFRAADPEKVPN